jgi:hypothetical protein
VLETYVVGTGPVRETFTFTASSSTADAICTGLVALIDASDHFAAAGTTEITVTSQDGLDVTLVESTAPGGSAVFTVTDNQLCARVPDCYFDHSRTGAGLVEIRLRTS